MITVKQAEKFAYQTLSVDGLIDFWAGVAVLLIGVGWLREELVMLSIGAPPLAWSFWMISRRFLSHPRLGSVNLSDKKRTKTSMKLMTTALLGSAVLGTFAFLAFDPEGIGRDMLQDIIPMMPVFILAVMAGLGAMLLEAPRFYIYALWLAASAFLGMYYFGHPSAGMMFGSITPISGGIIHFALFVKNNPKADA